MLDAFFRLELLMVSNTVTLGSIPCFGKNTDWTRFMKMQFHCEGMNGSFKVLLIASCNCFEPFWQISNALSSVHLLRLYTNQAIFSCLHIVGTADQPNHVPPNGSSNDRNAEYLGNIVSRI